MKYYVYKITNKINQKYYIGKGSSESPYSHFYFGSGTLIKLAIKKHGIRNFSKVILAVFDNEEEEAFCLERELVTKEEIKCDQCYNLHEGGYGGWGHINKNQPMERPNIIALLEKYEDTGFVGTGTAHWTAESWEKVGRKARENIERGLTRNNYSGWRHKEETREKMSNSQRGKRNSSYGSVWCVLEGSEDYTGRKRFPKDQIPEGWVSATEHRDRKKKRNNAYGKKWFNDGVRNYLLPKEQGLGRGYSFGRIAKNETEPGSVPPSGGRIEEGSGVNPTSSDPSNL